eukprot:1155839-Pelagomonas_calceolata.AAC.19
MQEQQASRYKPGHRARVCVFKYRIIQWTSTCTSDSTQSLMPSLLLDALLSTRCISPNSVAAGQSVYICKSRLSSFKRYDTRAVVTCHGCAINFFYFPWCATPSTS